MRKKKIATALGLTMFVLLLGEVFSTSILPAIGLQNFQLGFHVLVVLFLAFRVHTTWYPYTILGVQYFHSLFTIEGWAIGTITGVMISLMIMYLKEMLDFSSTLATMILVFIFQVMWFLTSTALLSFKMGSFANFGYLFLHFLPEGLVLAALSPLLFSILDRIWSFITIDSGEVHI